MDQEMNPFKTLWRWACRWWTGREFERKPVAAEKPAEANAADFVDSTLPWSVSCRVNDGRGWRTLSTSCRGTVRLNVEPLDEEGCKITLNSVSEARAAAWRDALANAIEMRRSGNVIVDEPANPVGIFGSFSWKDKDGVVHGGPFRGQTLDDVANPLAGLTAEQIAARVNRGEPVHLKDAVEALGFKLPTSDNLVVDEAIKATILGGDVYCGEMLVTDVQVQGVTGPLDTLKYVYMLPDGTFTITRPSQDAKPIGRVSKVVKNGVANVETTP